MEGQTILACELLTPEQVTDFEVLMGNLGYDKYNRPAHFAERVPAWIEENRPRREREDPLAAIIVYFFHKSNTIQISAGFRCVETDAVWIQPEDMKYLILANGYKSMHKKI